MSKVRYHVTMSLDGFIAGPGHSMEWVFTTTGPDPQPIPEVPEVIASTGAVLAGRNAYESNRKPGQHPSAQAVYGGAFRGPTFIAMHEPPTDEADPSITFVSGDIRPIVEKALAAAGGKDLLVLGGTLAKQCIEAGLLDEILIHINPILLGDGIPLFRSTGPGVPLELVSSTRAGHITTVRYAVPH